MKAGWRITGIARTLDGTEPAGERHACGRGSAHCASPAHAGKFAYRNDCGRPRAYCPGETSRGCVRSDPGSTIAFVMNDRVTRSSRSRPRVSRAHPRGSAAACRRAEIDGNAQTDRGKNDRGPIRAVAPDVRCARINRDTHAQPRHFEHASIPSRVPSLLSVRTSAHAAPARPFDAPRAARCAPARKARSARAGVGARSASPDTANRKRRTS
ncbi:hypothetical protein Y603_1075 [Burkholderia pseudomallei MSHR1153]|nr:hypothetical protein Y603_1075 [Burkholderia pseudomallei MSHR1153]